MKKIIHITCSITPSSRLVRSTMTKIVVFDGWTKTSSGLSLNDTQINSKTNYRTIYFLFYFGFANINIMSADKKDVSSNISQNQIVNSIFCGDRIGMHQLIVGIKHSHLQYRIISSYILQEIRIKCTKFFSESNRIIMKNFYIDDLLTDADIFQNFGKDDGDLEHFSRSQIYLVKWLPIVQQSS